MSATLQDLLEICVNRNDLPAILNTVGLTDFMIEVGVAEGGYSEFFRQRWLGQKYYMVDPWIEQPVEEYVDGCNGPQDQQDAKMVECYRKMAVYPPETYEIIRGMSLSVVKEFPDAYFDCVYIDANHNYHAVSADIKAWAPKVKPGGLLAGHDYVEDCATYGVMRAVIEFAAETSRRTLLIRDTEHGAPSWAFIM